MKRSIYRSLAVLTVAVLLGGCEDMLTVNNPNSGNSEKVLKTPGDVENLLGSYFKRWHSGVYGSINNLEGMASNLAFMSYSSLANNCMNNHTPFTGATNFNSPGNTCGGEQQRLYQILSEVNKVSSIVLGRMKAGLDLGTPARNLRAKAFGEFLAGISVGYIAMMHDSLAIANENTTQVEITGLIDYREAAESAYVFLGRALAYTTDPVAAGTDGFPLPGTWIPSATSMSVTNFAALIRSYRARIRAGMARTPAERADIGAGGIVDWAAVIADVTGGIAANHQITTNSVSGPTHGGWKAQFTVFGLWHQMPPFWIGMADNSGSYAAWLGTPMGSRGAGNNGFFMTTPDLRFPQGLTRAAQQTDFAITSCNTAGSNCARYFVNRPAGSDQYAGSGFGWSNYDNVRNYTWRIAGSVVGATGGNGPVTDIPMQEMNLLRAEGLYRQGSFAAAGALINLSRAAAGLPPITVFDATTVVPGGADCVPKIPPAAACGTMFEALKYEKRIETMMMHYASTFIDARGWGDLPQDTPLYWVTPFQELQARGKLSTLIYGAGIGAGNAPGSFAGTSVYGW